MLADGAVRHAGPVAEGAEGYKQGLGLGVRRSPHGIPCGSPVGHKPQRLVETPQEPDGAANLVIVVPGLRPLFVGQLVADGVNAGLGGVGQAHGRDWILVHVPQRVIPKDAAVKVVGGAGRRGVTGAVADTAIELSPGLSG